MPPFLIYNDEGVFSPAFFASLRVLSHSKSRIGMKYFTPNSRILIYHRTGLETEWSGPKGENITIELKSNDPTSDYHFHISPIGGILQCVNDDNHTNIERRMMLQKALMEIV
jgi:hypothetical protein